MLHILIADDHAVFRHGTRGLLREHLQAVVEEAENGTEMLRRAEERRWDLFIMDITMPGRSGTDLLHDLLRVQPFTPVLVFSVYPESIYAVRMLRSGARGYLNKATSLDELLTAVRTLVAGNRYITSMVAESLVESIQRGPSKGLHDCLSNREFQIVPLLAAGMRLKEIAGKLSVSTSTVSTYRRRLLGKLGIKNNAELTQYAVEHSLTAHAPKGESRVASRDGQEWLPGASRLRKNSLGALRQAQHEQKTSVYSRPLRSS